MFIRTNRKYQILFWICLAGLLGKLIEFSIPPVLHKISASWSLSGFEEGALFAAFRVGYILSVLFIGTLMDSYGSRKVMLSCSLIVGFAGCSFALFAHNFIGGFLLRVVAGIGGAGIYIPGIKLLSEWFPKSERGRAIGFYVGVFMVGNGLSVLSTGMISSVSRWEMGVLSISLPAFIGAGIILFFVEEKSFFHDTSVPVYNSLSFRLLKNKPLMLTIAAYAGHSWELFGMWGWVPTFMITSLAVAGYVKAEIVGTLLSAVIIGTGGLASLFVGHISDRIGRSKTVIMMLCISGLISLFFGWLHGASVFAISSIGLIYGFFVAGESPIFSASVTELASKGGKGAALGLQSFIGFLPPLISPVIFGTILDATNGEWGFAFAILSFGPFIGVLAIICQRKYFLSSG